MVANDSGETRSTEVVGSVVATPFQLWKENAFEDPFILASDPLADPDFDNKPNGLEFVLKEDPLSGITNGYPRISYESIEGISYLVCAFNENPFDAVLRPVLEKNVHLMESQWTPVILEESSVVVEGEAGSYRLLFPIEGSAFYRLRLPDA